VATVYDHIAQNTRRTVLLILLFPVVFAVLTWGVLSVAFAIAGASASEPEMQMTFSDVGGVMLLLMPFFWAGAMLWMFISWLCGDKMLLKGAGATAVTAKDNPEIYRLVENLCISRGLPVPKIYIMDDESLNAFATGRDPKHASIALTKGIIGKLERVELEGVIAHELSHVENRDIRLMLLTVAGISFFTFAGELCLRSCSRRSKGNGNAILLLLGLIFLLYGYVLAPLLRLAVSRQREYQADASAALMTRHPSALASALRKISADSRVEALDAHASMAAMCIANPLKKEKLFAWLSGLTATHPPIEKRIAALEDMDRGY
jgi:heat shock protein HtpX